MQPTLEGENVPGGAGVTRVRQMAVKQRRRKATQWSEEENEGRKGGGSDMSL